MGVRKVYRVLQCYIYKKNLINLGRQRDGISYNDYFRFSSLELIAYEITEKNIPGCVAEFGVFRGEFAKYINSVFPDRKLFLFDTFEGFDVRDIKTEINNNYSSAQKNDFSDTSVNLVIKKMKYPENCIVKKGYFPETAMDIEEKFVFVSIDVDLFDAIYNGLCYFYPRLMPGGYIFVHDYNFTKYSGTKDAVKKYAAENKLTFFPMSDIYGTAVFMK